MLKLCYNSVQTDRHLYERDISLRLLNDMINVRIMRAQPLRTGHVKAYPSMIIVDYYYYYCIHPKAQKILCIM